MSTDLTRQSHTLYELASDLQAWQESLELCETEEDRLLCEQRISECLDMTASKVDRFVWYLKHTESLIELAKAEEARLRDRRHSLERFIASMKRGAVWVLRELGMTKLQGEVSSIRTWGTGDSVEIKEALKVPAQFRRGSVSMTARQWAGLEVMLMDEELVDAVDQYDFRALKWKQDYGDSAFDRRAILADFKATGIVPPGCDIKQGQKTLRVE